MPITQELRAQRDRIDHFVVRINTETDDFKRSVFAKWLIMQTAGFIEYGMQETIAEYVRARSNRNISDFSARQIERYLSINVEKAEEILGAFSSTWVAALRLRATPAQIEAVNSVKSLRDLFAHGKDNGIRWSTACDYWRLVKDFIDHVDAVMV